jgi:hypothetical protein
MRVAAVLVAVVVIGFWISAPFIVVRLDASHASKAPVPTTLAGYGVPVAVYRAAGVAVGQLACRPADAAVFKDTVGLSARPLSGTLQGWSCSIGRSAATSAVSATVVLADSTSASPAGLEKLIATTSLEFKRTTGPLRKSCSDEIGLESDVLWCAKGPVLVTVALTSGDDGFGRVPHGELLVDGEKLATAQLARLPLTYQTGPGTEALVVARTLQVLWLLIIGAAVVGGVVSSWTGWWARRRIGRGSP